MLLKSAILNIKKWSSAGIKAASIKVLNKSDSALIAKLKEHSPYDPDRKSGPHFRDQWKVRRRRFGSSGTLAGLVIINDTPAYGQFAASGAEPVSAPWYFPHRDKKTGRFTKHSGKLKAADGKIWAGGLNPGHSKTVGGVIENALSDKSAVLSKLSIDLSNELVKAFL